MKAFFTNWDEPTLDLAIGRFTVGLSEREEAKLDRLVESDELDQFENAVAAVHLAGLGELEAPPAEFLRRLERAGRQHVANHAPLPELKPEPVPAFSSRALTYGGWLVAAALLLFFRFQPDDVAAPKDQRATLIADATDLIQLDWTATEDPLANGASGDVVWSSDLQQGYLRFRNLSPNDPKESQYQLWIFDPTRANWEAKPVDGGVFDISHNGEVIVPIDAKLTVLETSLFAVTLEVPGGVVVSEREHLVLTAAL